MRVAIIHDWLLGMRGGERCLEVLCRMFPEAELYTAFYNPENITEVINAHPVTTSVLQRLPSVEQYYRYLLPLYPYAARSLAKSIRSKPDHYDLVISVSHCLAKNVPLPSHSVHLSYCLTPMRYIWDQYDAYFRDNSLEPLIRVFAKRLQKWDQKCAQSVDSFVGISEFICQRIKRVYNRDARVIYPPVRTDWLSQRDPEDQGEGFLCVSALVPYKNVDLIVRTFNKLGQPLSVVGSGPEREKLHSIAGKNIRFYEQISDFELSELYKRSKALVFAAEEDFGMTPVEMQACGRPVISLGQGGSTRNSKCFQGQTLGDAFFRVKC